MGTINIEKVIEKCDEKYFFYDEPEPDFDYSYAIGIMPAYTDIGYHACHRSALYDDMNGYVDKIQNEENLPEKEKYIVCYYRADSNNIHTLYQEVDFDITKSEIIANVISQKYREGADYYLLKDMRGIE